MRPSSDLSRYDWTVLVLTFVGSGTPGLLTLALTTESNINVGTIVLATIIPLATTAAVLVSLVAGNRKRNAVERQERRRLAQSLIEDYLETVVKDLSKRPESTGPQSIFWERTEGYIPPTGTTSRASRTRT